MAETYTLIESLELPGSSSVATFLSISGSYTDLVIQGHVTIVAPPSADLYLRFNNDTGSNYYGQGAGSNASSLFRSDQYSGTAIRLVGTINSQQQTQNPNMFEAQINEYANGSYTKNGVQNWSYLAQTSSNIANVGFGAFQWRNTSAITRIDISSSTGGNLTGRISLYGILAGNA